MEIMQDERKQSNGKEAVVDVEDAEPIELVLYQVSECYVYMIPPRKSAASYRADEWDVNNWAWEGALKVVSRREECIIKLEDKSTGELYARAFLREGEPHPVEAVIDSSRYFVLRVEENIDGRLRHAFLGLGFRERPEAYDFQAALHDHIKYLDKKKTAEEMEQQYQNTNAVDYSLKDGETLVLDLKNKSGGVVRSKSLERENANNLSPNGKSGMPCISIKPPPPPPSSTVSPVKTKPPMSTTPRSLSPRNSFTEEVTQESAMEKKPQSDSTSEAPDDDFGDFQTAG